MHNAIIIPSIPFYGVSTRLPVEFTTKCGHNTLICFLELGKNTSIVSNVRICQVVTYYKGCIRIKPRIVLLLLHFVIDVESQCTSYSAESLSFVPILTSILCSFVLCPQYRSLELKR